MTKVAIITRTKDRPLFLRRALQSVKSQSFSDYIHVVVNDGGDKAQVDGLISELDREHRSKTKVVHRPKSSNAPDTIFTESVDAVDSEYVVIHDDDDTWHENFLLKAVSKLDESDERVGGVVVRTDKVMEELLSNGSIRTINSKPWLPGMKVVNLYRQCAENQLTPISFLYKRSAYIGAGKYDSSLPVCGDWEFGIRFLCKYDVDFLDPGYSLAFYHHRKYAPGAQGNTSFAGNDRHRYYANLIMNRYLREELAGGRLGVGYIMSKIRYEQGFVSRLVQSVMPRFVAERLKRRY